MGEYENVIKCACYDHVVLIFTLTRIMVMLKNASFIV